MAAQKFNFDCIIIGGGPAGLTAATYLLRFRRSVLIIDKNDARLKLAPCIRNLIGYSNGISGLRLLKKIKAQAAKYKPTEVTGFASVARNKKNLDVLVNGQLYTSKYVILATGVKDRQPSNVDFASLCKLGVLAYCPICDGFDHRNKKIAVLIDSNAGFKKVNFLTDFSDLIHAIAIKKFKISAGNRKLMDERSVPIYQNKLIDLNFDSATKKLVISLQGGKDLKFDLAYVELGLRVPKFAIKNLRGLRRTEGGRLLVNKHQQTSIKGLFAIGDCTNSLAQISVAVGEAAIAATAIHNELRKLK